MAARITAPAVVAVIVCALAPAYADVNLSLYGNLDGVIKTTGTRATTEDGFSAAQLDLFATATEGRWSLLTETLFEANDENEFVLDVERIQVGYLVREWLRVSVGRFHTAIGYYNDAFHHGTYFMMAVSRPAMVSFEDEGGLIPAHNVGVHADGRFTVGESHLRYDVELANGHGADALAIQNAHDGDRAKMGNLRLRYEPGGSLEGLVIGGNLAFDGISRIAMSTEPGAPAPRPALHEWIVGAHAAYLAHDVQLITEAMLLQRTEVDTGVPHRTYAMFVEAGRTIDDVTPYARYELARFPDDPDPYTQKTTTDDYQTATLGVKHSTTENVALKAEAAVTFSRAPGSDPLFVLTAQLAFAF